MQWMLDKRSGGGQDDQGLLGAECGAFHLNTTTPAWLYHLSTNALLVALTSK